MADLIKDQISHKGKRIQKYSLEVKKEVITYAEVHGNRPASRKFQVDERRIREWRAKKREIEGLVGTEKGKKRSKLGGGGRKPFSSKLEKVLLEWIDSRQAGGLRVSCKLIVEKAEIIYSDMKESNHVDEDFKASRGWLSRFMKRNCLSLRRKPPVVHHSSRQVKGQSCSTGQAVPQSQLDNVIEPETNPLECDEIMSPDEEAYPTMIFCKNIRSPFFWPPK